MPRGAQPAFCTSPGSWCLYVCVSGPRVGPVTDCAGTPKVSLCLPGVLGSWGPGVPIPATKSVPGSSAAHLHSTRCNYLQPQAQRPPHGLPSCLPHGLARPGIPPVPHSRGGNKPGAVEWREPRVRAPWSEMLPPGPPTPIPLDPPVSQAPKPFFLPLNLPWPSFKSPLVSHTNTKDPSKAYVHTHTVPCPYIPTDVCKGTG